MDVLEIVAEMPGIKKSNNVLHGVSSAKGISRTEYEYGKEKEKDNLYLQGLMSFNKRTMEDSA